MNHYTATQRANATTIPARAYRVLGVYEGKSYSGKVAHHDPSGNRRVNDIHNGVVERHTHGLVRFVGDRIVLAVDPATVREAMR